MIARSPMPFTLRSILNRVRPTPTAQRSGRVRGWQHMIAALEDWWTTSYLAWQSEILPGGHAERVPPILPKLR